MATCSSRSRSSSISSAASDSTRASESGDISLPLLAVYNSAVVLQPPWPGCQHIYQQSLLPATSNTDLREVPHLLNRYITLVKAFQWFERNYLFREPGVSSPNDLVGKTNFRNYYLLASALIADVVHALQSTEFRDTSLLSLFRSIVILNSVVNTLIVADAHVIGYKPFVPTAHWRFRPLCDSCNRDHTNKTPSKCGIFQLLQDHCDQRRPAAAATTTNNGKDELDRVNVILANWYDQIAVNEKQEQEDREYLPKCEQRSGNLNLSITASQWAAVPQLHDRMAVEARRRRDEDYAARMRAWMNDSWTAFDHGFPPPVSDSEKEAVIRTEGKQEREKERAGMLKKSRELDIERIRRERQCDQAREDAKSYRTVRVVRAEVVFSNEVCKGTAPKFNLSEHDWPSL